MDLQEHLHPEELEVLRELTLHKLWPLYLRLLRRLEADALRSLAGQQTLGDYKYKDGFAAGVRLIVAASTSIYESAHDTRVEETKDDTPGPARSKAARDAAGFTSDYASGTEHATGPAY